MSNNTVVSEFRPNGQSSKPGKRRIRERILAAIGHSLKAVGEQVAEARRAQQVFDELNTMTDRELEDIGIRRFDIPAVVAGTYRSMRLAASNVIPLGRRRAMRSSDRVAASPKKPSAA